MTVSPSVPGGLRDRVLAASRTARSGGRAVPTAPAIAATDAFERAAAAFSDLLSALSPDQWPVTALRDLTVQGLVGHLIGVEQDFQRALRGDAEVADADHITATQPLAVAQQGRTPAETGADWRSTVDRTLEMLAATDVAAARQISMHGVRMSVDALLVVRAFELWTHENDIRAAAGMSPSVPDPSVLTLMTELAVQLLPHAVARDTMAAAIDLHLVLVGVGGGTWDLRLDRRTGKIEPAELMIVISAVDFCRLVANRVAPDAVDLQADGEGAAEVLAAAASLALD